VSDTNIKVLQVNFSDLNGGAARAAYRINVGLRKLGVESQMLVLDQREVNHFVIMPLGKYARLLQKIKAVLSQRLLRFQYTKNSVLHSLNYFSNGLADWINRSDFDLVNLHWIGSEMLSVEEISRIKKPICWTMHDMWPFSGAEHYDDLESSGRYQSGYFTHNRPNHYSGPDLDAWVWRRKRKVWNGKLFHLISPSSWLADCAKRSVLFEKQPCKIINNGIDLARFNPVDRKQARSILGLSENKNYILFGAMSSTSDVRKGFHLLLPAIEKLASIFNAGHDIELLIFGASAPNESVGFGLPVHYMGHLYDEVSLAIVYSAADVFAAPSMQDNLPNTLVEALACGTPCVGFNVGGMPDLIEHGLTGYLASKYDVDDFARGLLQILEADAVEMRIACRRKAEKQFSDLVVAQKYLDYYQEILQEEIPNR
jgi:glycosyltransferase involved in cell wall biosynthesis